MDGGRPIIHRGEHDHREVGIALLGVVEQLTDPLDTSAAFERAEGEFAEIQQRLEKDRLNLLKINGAMLDLTITAVGEESVTVDGNHPFAGKTLTYAVTVADIRDATDEDEVVAEEPDPTEMPDEPAAEQLSLFTPLARHSFFEETKSVHQLLGHLLEALGAEVDPAQIPWQEIDADL